MEEVVTYEVNEDVIIEDNTVYYEGRIMETKDGKYLVHFNGWPKKYDRWVPPESIIKQNEMNRALMKMNNKSNKEREDKPYYKMSILNELNSLSEIKQQYGFPFLLKQRLIEEWYVVESQQRFLPLPRVPNVKQILQTWETECKAESTASHQNTIELIQGLIFYMNNCMDRSIIYRPEMPQFERVKHLKPSGFIEVYGAEHLLRTVFMIPMMYSSTDLSERESEMIHEVMMGLYQFLLRHPTYFCNLEEYTTLDESIKHLFVLYFVLCIPLLFPLNSTGEGHTRDSLQDIQRIASR